MEGERVEGLPCHRQSVARREETALFGAFIRNFLLKDFPM